MSSFRLRCFLGFHFHSLRFDFISLPCPLWLSQNPPELETALASGLIFRHAHMQFPWKVLHGKWQLCCLEDPAIASSRKHFNLCFRFLDSSAASFAALQSLAATRLCGPVLHWRLDPAGISLPSQSTGGLLAFVLLPAERCCSGRRGRRHILGR